MTDVSFSLLDDGDRPSTRIVPSSASSARGGEPVASRAAGEAECDRRLDENVTAMRARFESGRNPGDLDFRCVVLCAQRTVTETDDGRIVVVAPDADCRIVTGSRAPATSLFRPRHRTFGGGFGGGFDDDRFLRPPRLLWDMR